jgi:hypothetical protein
MDSAPLSHAAVGQQGRTLEMAHKGLESIKYTDQETMRPFAGSMRDAASTRFQHSCYITRALGKISKR